MGWKRELRDTIQRGGSSSVQAMILQRATAKTWHKLGSDNTEQLMLTHCARSWAKITPFCTTILFLNYPNILSCSHIYSNIHSGILSSKTPTNIRKTQVSTSHHREKALNYVLIYFFFPTVLQQVSFYFIMVFYLLSLVVFSYRTNRQKLSITLLQVPAKLINICWRHVDLKFHKVWGQFSQNVFFAEFVTRIGNASYSICIARYGTGLHYSSYKVAVKTIYIFIPMKEAVVL